MSFELAQQALENRMSALWTATPLQYDNTKFVPPVNAPWVRMAILDGDSSQISLGGSNRTVRAVGLLTFQIFSPAASGGRISSRLVDQLTALWRMVTVGGILFRTPSVTRVGDAGNGWYQVNVSIPFQRDEPL